MELKQFTKDVLKQLTEAVRESEAESDDSYFSLASSPTGETITFDIAVAAESGNAVDGTVGIKVLSLGGLGAGAKSSTRDSTASHIHFRVYTH